jgi:HlyD family secretion protein
MTKRRLLTLALIIVGTGAAMLTQMRGQDETLPAGIVTGNGRIEAEEVDIAPAASGRVAEINVGEGELVDKGQVLARMDTDELAAEHDRAAAEVAFQREMLAEAQAVVAQRGRR